MTNKNMNQHAFTLRGNSVNPMIDAATPLLGMVQRLRDITHLDNAESLYRQVVNDMGAIEQILQSQGYENSQIVSFRYILCTFIDEVAMQHPWDNQNTWGNQSLLVKFHNEAWGGERAYLLLERLQAEPKRYKDLLEFIYICFCLGFRGRYKVIEGNSEEFNRIFRRLHDQIIALKEDSDAGGTLLHQGRANTSKYSLSNRLSIKRMSVWLAAGLCVVYVFYQFKLHSQSMDILAQLNKLLH
ncbi:type IVB secretion system protein IcmH/DotU [Budvicia aquatica]|uniref:Uncharacterized protein conserved in bacteria n=1 Tax=Budvicia aquatica TaxID=82979 RepID=A0A2C6DKC4_9GAMM|nr:type IVB secretion system protein IcmH/DotU [Budvicia aquatica]PHI31686.1 hypothetical protein CRN84_21305 [Budvicia aquatica]VFS52426.1 Uncharacterized protein conserved in bacteria [Budvicia aquatica]